MPGENQPIDGRAAYERHQAAARQIPANKLRPVRIQATRFATALDALVYALLEHWATFAEMLSPKCFVPDAFLVLREYAAMIVWLDGRLTTEGQSAERLALRKEVQAFWSRLYQQAGAAAVDHPAVAERLAELGKRRPGVSKGQELTQLVTFIRDEAEVFGAWPKLGAEVLRKGDELSQAMRESSRGDSNLQDLLIRAVNLAYEPAMRVWNAAQFLFEGEPAILEKFPRPSLSASSYPGARRGKSKTAEKTDKKPVETKPAETKTTETKTTETKPADPKPTAPES